MPRGELGHRIDKSLVTAFGQYLAAAADHHDADRWAERVVMGSSRTTMCPIEQKSLESDTVVNDERRQTIRATGSPSATQQA